MTTSHSLQSIIQQAKQAWLDGNAFEFANLFATNGEFIVPGQTWRGRQEIVQAFEDFSHRYSVKSIVIRNIVIQGDRAMLEWYWEDTEIATGKSSKAEDAIAIDFQGEQIQRWREYIDDVP